MDDITLDLNFDPGQLPDISSVIPDVSLTLPVDQPAPVEAPEPPAPAPMQTVRVGPFVAAPKPIEVEDAPPSKSINGLPAYWTPDIMRRAEGIHPDLMRVVSRAAEIGDVQFVVGNLGGKRDQATQDNLVAKGFSKTRNSNHLTGRALDLWPVVGGKANPDATPEDYTRVSNAMKKAAAELGIKVNWGGDWKNAWDRPHWELDTTHKPLPSVAAPAPGRIHDTIREAARETGISYPLLLATANAESSLNPKADNGKNRGLFQFNDETWTEMQGRYGSLYGVQNATPFDPRAASILGARRLMEVKNRYDKELGRPVTDADVYAGFFLGPTGGKKFLDALAQNPDAPASEAASPNAVARNRAIFFDGDKPRTVGQVYALLGQKVAPVTPEADLKARTDPRDPINVHDVWAPPPLPVDKKFSDAALEAKRMQTREERMGFWQGTAESLTTDSLTARGLRALTARWTPDPEYAGSEAAKADLEQLTAALPESYLPRFGNAVSRDHMVEIARQARAEHSLHMQLQAAGWKGTAAQLVSAFVDPASLGIGVLTGGAGIEAAVALKMGQLGSRLIGAGAGAVGNVSVEAALSSLNKEEMSVSQLALAASLGATFGAAFGPIGRNVALQREAAELEMLVRAPVQDNVIPFPVREAGGPAPEGQGGQLQAVGAAVNTGAIPEVLSDPVFRAMHNDSVPETKLATGRFSEGGKAAGSANPITRMAGGMLGIDTIGKRNLGENPISADQEMARYFRVKQYDWRSVATPAFNEWAEAQGQNWLSRSVGRGWQEFNERVVAYVRNRDPQIASSAPEPIKRAGEHFRKLMKEMAEDQRNPWLRKNGRPGGSVAGAEELMPDPNYVMRVWSPAKINAAIERFGHSGVVRTIAASIKNLRPDIEDDLAEKFSEAILRSRYTRSVGYDDRLERAFSNADTATLADMLRGEFAWGEDDIRRILERLRHTEPNMAPHLKHRIQLDENFVMRDVNGYGTGDLTVADLLENHADLLMGYYSRKVSGRVALAQQRFVNPINGDVVVDGIKSDQDFEAIIRRATQWHMEHGTDTAAVKKEIEGLRWMYNRIKGVPDEAQLTEWADWLRVAKNYNFARMMGQIGFAQMMDVGRIVGTLGVKSFTQQLRGFKRIVNMDGRSILAHGMDHELEAVFGLGTDRLRGFAAMVWEEAGQLKAVSRGRAVDKAQAVSEGLASFTGEVSGMHYINSWLQLMVGRAAAQKFANMASGRLSRSDMRQLRFLGLSDDKLDRVFAQVRQNFSHEDGFLFGRRVTKLNLDSWQDIEARSAFESALFRWSRHIVQENDIGSMHRMMSHPIAQTLLQFRSYSMTAWENQLLHGIANPDGRTFAQFTASMFSGALVYAVQTQLQAIGRSDAGEFLEKKLSPTAFGLAVFQRAGFSSLLPMLIDTAAVFTPAGPVFDARPSGQATDFIFGNPFFSLIDDVRKTTSAVMNSAWTGRDLTQQELRQMARTIMLQNTMPIIQGYSLLISGQPEKR